MRKTEPLRNKVVFRVREQNGFEWEDYERNIDIEGMDKQTLVRKFFYLHDVKQAVQGLLEEIDGEKIKSKLRLKYSYNVEHEKGYQEAIEDSIDLIKKWFPDVVLKNE